MELCGIIKDLVSSMYIELCYLAFIEVLSLGDQLTEGLCGLECFTVDGPGSQTPPTQEFHFLLQHLHALGGVHAFRQVPHHYADRKEGAVKPKNTKTEYKMLTNSLPLAT